MSHEHLTAVVAVHQIATPAHRHRLAPRPVSEDFVVTNISCRRHSHIRVITDKHVGVRIAHTHDYITRRR